MNESKRKTPFRWWEIVIVILVIAFFAAIAIPSRPDRRGSPKNTCINNLRQIDGGKQQWALKNGKQTNDIPTHAEVAAFLKNNIFPTCPQNGTYTIGRVDQEPLCSIPGHKLP